MYFLCWGMFWIETTTSLHLSIFEGSLPANWMVLCWQTSKNVFFVVVFCRAPGSTSATWKKIRWYLPKNRTEHLLLAFNLGVDKHFLTRKIWLVVWAPLKNISQLAWLFSIYGKIKNVPNHKPEIHPTNRSLASVCLLSASCERARARAAGRFLQDVGGAVSWNPVTQQEKRWTTSLEMPSRTSMIIQLMNDAIIIDGKIDAIM